MYFRFQQTANLVTVDDAFARLTKVLDNGDLVFEFTYSVTPADAINHQAHVVAVNVLSRYVKPQPMLGNTQRGIVDTVSLIRNIRTLLPDVKTVLQQRDKYVLVSKNSDIVAYINNEILQLLRSQVAPRDILQLNVPQLKLVPASQVKASNDAQPLLHRLANSAAVPDLQLVLTSSFLAQPQKLMQDMIVRQGFDPTHIMQLTPRAQPESSVRGGLSNPSTALEVITDPTSQLLNFHLFPTSNDVPPTTTDQVIDTELVQILTTVTNSTIEIPITVVIPASNLRLEQADLTNVFVQFDLVDSYSGQPVDTVIKTLNIARELQVFNTPKLPPIIKAASSPASTRASLQIKQVDPTASVVQVFKKVIHAAVTELDKYSLIGTYNLTAQQQALQIQIDMPVASAAIYRVIPVGKQNTQGFEFSNVVLKPPRYTSLRAISLVGSQIDQGIQLEVRRIPIKCVAIQFLRWNQTTHDSTFTIVNGDVGFVDDATRVADLIVVIDNTVHSSNVYKYVCRLIYEDGTTQDAGHVTLEFIQPSPGQVDTKVTDLVVSHDTVPDVSFTITTLTIDTDMDAIKRMLGNIDIQEFFQGDIQSQRNELKSLIAHNVQRVDLTTGAREDFGTITVDNFVDSDLRKNRSIDPLQYGHVYRYEIYPLLRAAETMFFSFVKTAVDPTTKKPYQFLPAKFLHPLALTQGVIVSATGARQRYAKDAMSFGVVGVVTSVEVSFDNDTAKIVKQVATRFDRSLNIVSWQVQGDVGQVDHFIIMKEVHGIRTVLGKAHAEFPFGTCQYFHPLLTRDNGALSYVIIPVMNDYKVGPSASTNIVVVDVPWR
jgi:hypothetical protein